MAHSWYEYQAGDDVALHPFKARRSPNYTGPKPPVRAPRARDEHDKKYSWLKSPRYDDEPMEVGPLARMLVAYVSGHARVKELVDAVLKQLKVGPEALFSTLGRVAARGIETQVLAEKMDEWVDALAANMGSGELRIHDNSKWDPSTWPAEAIGRRIARSAARRARPLGAHSQRHASATISAWCRAPGTPARATRKDGAVHTRRRCSARRSPIPSGRSRFSGPCIRSIRAWPAACTSSTRSGARVGAREGGMTTPHRRGCVRGHRAASTCGRRRCASRTG